ncbi:MAG: class II glutamine amidotransferase [Actinomycetales bacterium]
MCRLLAAVSTQPAPLAQTLAPLLPGFTALSEFHQDGWGVAGFDTEERLVVDKEPTRAKEDPDYTAAVDALTTDSAMLHIRWATATDMGNVCGNTHPFVRDGWAFAHNGSAEPTSEILPLVDEDLRQDLEGDTDSELIFRAILSRMRSVDPDRAILDVARELRARTVISGLNFLLLGEDALYVLADHDPQSPPSKRHGPDYFPLRYHVLPHLVVVSSTGYEQVRPDWEEVPQGHVLRVARRSLELRLTDPDGARHDVAVAGAPAGR